MTDPTTTNENSGSNTANPARDLFEHAANAAYYANHPHPRGARGDAVTVQRNGKNNTGRVLDGNVWDEFPASAA